MSNVVVKVLVDLKELTELRRIAKLYQEQEKTKTIEKEGFGNTAGPSGDHLEVTVPFTPSQESDHIFDNRAPIIDGAKTVLVEKEPSLSDEVILSQIKERHKKKSAKLLKRLRSSSKYSHDSHGIVTINSQKVDGSSIIRLLPSVFYNYKVEPAGLQMFLKLIEEDNLLSNEEAAHKEEEILPSDWYYLGPASS